MCDSPGISCIIQESGTIYDNSKQRPFQSITTQCDSGKNCCSVLVYRNGSEKATKPLHCRKGHALAAAGIFLITSSDATKSSERTASVFSRQEKTYEDVTWSFFSLKKTLFKNAVPCSSSAFEALDDLPPA